MLAHTGKIVAVRQAYTAEKVDMGWVVVARESDVLPFNVPRLIVADEGEDES